MKEKNLKKDFIEEEIQETLDSLDNTEDISVNPYFYSKLKANIDSLEQSNVSWAEKYIFNNRIAPAMFTLLVLINIFSFSIQFSQKNEIQTENREKYIEDTANEYMISGSLEWYEK